MNYFRKKTFDFTILLQLSAIGLVILGLVFRFSQYFANRSLWLDEAFLAFNIVNHSFIKLTQPLDYVQAAPIFFVWIERLIVKILGNTEFTLRLFPLFCGCLSVIIFYLLVRRIFKSGGLLALSLIVLNGYLVYYSSEVKQYSTDLLVSLFLLWLFSRVHDGTYSLKYLVLYTLVGTISFWLSYPSLFILSSIGLLLFLRVLINKKYTQLFQIGIIFFIWAISFAGLYWVSLRSTQSNPTLNQFWQQYFMPMPPWNSPSWFIPTFERLFRESAWVFNTSLAKCHLLFFRNNKHISK